MSTWRDAILDDFVPQVSKLTLVADPDSLLIEEKLASELRRRGFDIIEFSDPIEFRYAYESKYRSIWDRGTHTDLVVILRLHNSELESLPYDLLQAGRKLAFNLGEIFPNLSYPIIEALDRRFLDALFDAQEKHPPERMGDNATKDYILRHVFGIAAELIATDVDIIRTLLRIHYGKLQLPRMLAERILSVVNGNHHFQDWPLAAIILNEHSFYAFLQERWPLYLDTLDDIPHVGEPSSRKGLAYGGPATIQFGHQDIKVYVDNLFLEGKLVPVVHRETALQKHSWVRVGIQSNDEHLAESRIERLIEIIEQEMPSEECRQGEWLNFSLKWAELCSLVYQSDLSQYNEKIIEKSIYINKAFSTWLAANFVGLINVPPQNPTMVHHIPRRLARDIEESNSKGVALIVVDGLALDQWITVRQALRAQKTKLSMHESAVFAWIPTLTSVSRQSIFSGKPPLYFPSSIHSTNSEEKQWKQFWEEQGIARLDIAYRRGLGDGSVQESLDTIMTPGKTRVVGLVVDKIDKIMHGMQLGAAGMHNQIEQWIKGGFLSSLIDYLMDSGYTVWLTADHGNIDCKGIGKPKEGTLSEIRGERARVYTTKELRSRIAQDFPSAHEWEPIGLPANYFPLVAGEHDAFALAGETLVGHGSISLQEVVVPLVKFEKREH
jgi:hypothetical protein